MKNLRRKRNIPLLASIVIAIFFLCGYSAVYAADQLKKYGDSRFFYEEVRATIVELNENGEGLLRILDEECAECFVDAPFDSSVNLNTPLGHYYGLEKLADWSDRPVQVAVSNDTGQVIVVWVLP